MRFASNGTASSSMPAMRPSFITSAFTRSRSWGPRRPRSPSTATSPRRVRRAPALATRRLTRSPARQLAKLGYHRAVRLRRVLLGPSPRGRAEHLGAPFGEVILKARDAQLERGHRGDVAKLLAHDAHLAVGSECEPLSQHGERGARVLTQTGEGLAPAREPEHEAAVARARGRRDRDRVRPRGDE